MPVALVRLMDEPEEEGLQQHPLPGKIGGVLAPDAPWTPSRSPASLLMTLTIAGILGGWLEGFVLHQPKDDPSGDALSWTSLEDLTTLGFSLGTAAGLAVILSRRLTVRLTLGILLGTLLVTLNGLANVSLSGMSPDRLLSLKDPRHNPTAAGIWLGAPAGAVLAFSIHVLRKSTGSPQGLYGALLLCGLLGIQDQGFYWAMAGKAPLIDLGSASSPRVEFLPPEWIGAAVFEFCIAGSVLGLELFRVEMSRRRAARWIVPSVAVAGLLAVSGVIWTFQSMPWTPPSAVQSLAFSPDGRTLVTTHRGHTLRLWHVRGIAEGIEPSLQEIRKVRVRCGLAGNLTFATDGRRVLATRHDKTLTLRDVESFAVLEEIDRPGCRFGLPVLARNGSCMAAVNGSDEIWLWQSEIGPPSLRQRPLILTAMHPDRLTFTPDGRLLISGDSNSAVTIWDTRTGNQIWDRNDSMGIAPSLPEPSPFVQALIAGLKRSDTEIPRAIWDEEGGHHNRNILARLDTSPSGCHFVAVNGASIHVWDLSSLSRILVNSWRSQRGWIDAVAYSPDGRLIALGDSSGEVWVSRAADEMSD